MVDASTFQTQQTAPAGNGAAQGKTQPGAGAAGIFASPDVSFMDLIFATATADGNGKAGKAAGAVLKAAKGEQAKAGTKAAQADVRATAQIGATGHGKPLTMEQLLKAIRDAGLTPEDLALATGAKPEGDEDIKAGKATDITKQDAAIAPVALTAAGKKLIAQLQSLLAGLPQDSKPIVLELSHGQIKQLSGKLQFSAGKDKAAPALIATGLTPEKLTRILKDLSDGKDNGEGFVIAIVQMVPADAGKSAIFLPRGVVVARPQSAAGDAGTPKTAAAPDNALAAKLNTLITGENGKGDAVPEESKFDEVMRILQEAQGKSQSHGAKAGPHAGDAKGPENAVRQIQNHIGAGLSTVPGTQAAGTGLSADFTINSVYPEGMGFGYNAQHGQAMTINGPAQFTSLVSQAQQAALPHPATQMVAATIAKATTSGENRNISIQLDPPELGKVSIKLELHKDHGVKAVLTAEKPETYMMMQRDAHVLHRALQDAGLDVGGGALSFELSQDGNLFQHDQQSGSGGGGGSGGRADNAGEAGTEIAINTTMDWYPDPETGVIRYSALV